MSKTKKHPKNEVATPKDTPKHKSVTRDAHVSSANYVHPDWPCHCLDSIQEHPELLALLSCSVKFGILEVDMVHYHTAAFMDESNTCETLPSLQAVVVFSKTISGKHIRYLQKTIQVPFNFCPFCGTPITLPPLTSFVEPVIIMPTAPSKDAEHA